ncbi:MAG: SDR family oxidoreductase [Gammaproteobacteria bacterium]|nr:SDR family oxidoreductase [Gammaproteobacteria bacterium]MDH4254265.1 SDR family oxidoreductase [Gammaproteobacteria bacterium]MDH5311111.1 SDR family oxidoreductase [Gammaproteobacteria bacterium]
MSGSPLQGRHAVVTGAGRGIGAAIVRSLAAAGANVTLLGRTRRMLDETAGLLPSGGRVHVAVCDVTNDDQVSTAIHEAHEALGPVHILVNNAGQSGSAPFRKTDAALWDAMLAVNLTGSYLCARAALPDMLSEGFGRIVNVSSTAGLVGYAYVTAYCAAKHGLIGLTRALALETARQGITVNAVCPGYTNTEMLRATVENIQSKTGRSESEAVASLTALNPQGKLVDPAEVAHTVRWLCEPGTESITGQSIVIAGGEVM